MALVLPQNFKNDIQSKDTSLVPVVVIGNWATDSTSGGNFIASLLNPEPIFISTNNIALNTLLEYSYIFEATDYTQQVIAYKPILLNIPSLKESVDIEKRNYKISSINLDISNLPYEGKRFTDIVGSQSLINIECRIYWLSPTSNYIVPSDIISTFTGFGSYSKELLQVYTGTIRRYTHSQDKVRLVIEDRSQSLLHKDLPQNSITTDDGVKYKPMVYGSVTNSPAILDSAGSSHKIWIDSDDSAALYPDLTDDIFSESVSPIKIYDNDYAWIPRKLNKRLHYYREIDPQVSGSGCEFQLWASITEQFTSSNNVITLSNTRLMEHSLIQGMGIYKPKTVSLRLNTPDVDNYNYSIQSGNVAFDYAHGDNVLSDQDLLDLADGTYDISYEKEFNVTITTVSEPTLDFPAHFALEIDCSPPLEIRKLNFTASDGSGGEVTINEGEAYLKNIAMNEKHLPFAIVWDFQLEGLCTWYTCISPLDHPTETDTFPDDVDDDFAGSMDGDELAYFPNFDPNYEGATQGFVGDDGLPIYDFGGSFDSLFSVWGSGDDGFTGYSKLFVHHHYFNKTYTIQPQVVKDMDINSTYYNNFKFRLGELDFVSVFDIEKPLTKKFYANVTGRNSGTSGYLKTGGLTDGVGTGGYRFPDRQITHIIKEELGYDKAVGTGIFQGTSWVNQWFTDFAIDKPINSKKLIETLASTSQLIPRFNYLGEFSFSTIPLAGGSIENNNNPSDNHLIKGADVIDFTYSRTKPEQIYTKVEFHHNWDYASEEFQDIETVEVGDLFTEVNNAGEEIPELTYDHTYYGLPSGDTTLHSESTLVVDDDRGKFIKDTATAKRFALLLLSWHCNQHLKMSKLKLPLKYMNLEVGDIVRFDELLGGIQPYGINYISSSYVNSQKAFSTFMVTSTNKTLEYCEIECVQMHLLKICDDADCFGVCGGDAYDDDCGVCNGGNASCLDCEETPNGTVVIDCFGVCGGDAKVDDCGVCYSGGESHEEWNTTCIARTSGTAGVEQIMGCTDPNADNYDADANTDDGSCTYTAEVVLGCTDEFACNYLEQATEGNDDAAVCTYAEENHDCDGNCTAPVDCEGECAGEVVYDDCGVCGGDNSLCSDCDGVPCNNENCIDGYPCSANNDCYVIDDCGECVSYLDSCELIEDCWGVAGGDAYENECGQCCRIEQFGDTDNYYPRCKQIDGTGEMWYFIGSAFCSGSYGSPWAYDDDGNFDASWQNNPWNCCDCAGVPRFDDEEGETYNICGDCSDEDDWDPANCDDCENDCSNYQSWSSRSCYNAGGAFPDCCYVHNEACDCEDLKGAVPDDCYDPDDEDKEYDCYRPDEGEDPPNLCFGDAIQFIKSRLIVEKESTQEVISGGGHWQGDIEYFLLMNGYNIYSVNAEEANDLVMNHLVYTHATGSTEQVASEHGIQIEYKRPYGFDLPPKMRIRFRAMVKRYELEASWNDTHTASNKLFSDSWGTILSPTEVPTLAGIIDNVGHTGYTSGTGVGTVEADNNYAEFVVEIDTVDEDGNELIEENGVFTFHIDTSMIVPTEDIDQTMGLNIPRWSIDDESAWIYPMDKPQASEGAKGFGFFEPSLNNITGKFLIEWDIEGQAEGGGEWINYDSQSHEPEFINECPAMGDLNGDGGYNVLDIVALANCILANNCDQIENGCAGDINSDGGWNVLDAVALANCVLAANCNQL